MNVIGIIAEYNPFHNGHIYQINKIKEIFEDSLVIVLLNGNFTERGDVSVINKWDKAKILLDHNVDLVIEMPTFYGISNADIFAMGSVKLLNELKIDSLVFGIEKDDIKELEIAAKCKCSIEYSRILKEELNKGYSYPKASFLAIEKLTNIKINSPNDILALSYIYEIYKNNYNISFYGIKRTTDYHSLELDDVSSASAIRNAIKNNISIDKVVPSNVLQYINNISIDDYFDLIKYKIISTDDLTIYHDVKEGIDNRIKKYIYESNALEELISKVKMKRFTYNRIKRILLYILLDIKKDITINDYIRPLAFNNRGKNYLKSIKKELSIPLVSNYSDNKDLLSLEFKVNSIYSLKMKDTNESVRNEFNKPIKK